MLAAKEYMWQVRKAEEDLKLIAQKRRHFMELGTDISNGLSATPVSHSSGGSRVETAGVGLADLIDELDAKEARFKALIREAQSLVDQLVQPRHRQVLTLRYFCGMTFEEVSAAMEYKDPRSVYKVHGYALQALQKILPKGIV